MDRSDFPTARPAAIETFSPSLVNQLLDCPTRVAFARDPELRAWQRPTTQSCLGLVAHAVAEKAARLTATRDPALVRAELEAQWDDECERQLAVLRRAWAPAEPPAPREWPGYAITRARTIRRAVRSAGSDCGELRREPQAAGVEMEIRDTVTGLVGRIDRIETDGASTRVVDLKTGIDQDELTEGQLRQLQLYAVLVRRRTGKWPTSIAVEDASGRQWVHDLDPRDAESSFGEAQEAVAAFNRLLGPEGYSGDAEPTADRCRYCSFRVLCRPYWELLRTDWQHKAVFGSTEGTGAADSSVQLRITSPVDAFGRAVRIGGLAAVGCHPRAKLAITGWSGTHSSSAQALWSTLVRTW